ncbi:hypothetical protein ACFL5O_10825 [Myxococcota bacterium]
MPSERFDSRQRARLQQLAGLRPPEQALAWNEVRRIDEERLWWTMQGLDRDALMVLFARALAEVPIARLERIFRDYVQPGQIGAGKEQAEQGLLASVEKFYGFARRGHFYEEIPYRGSQQSRCTELFVARYNALFDRSVASSGSGEPAEVRAAIEMLSLRSRLPRNAVISARALMITGWLEVKGEIAQVCGCGCPVREDRDSGAPAGRAQARWL